MIFTMCFRTLDCLRLFRFGRLSSKGELNTTPRRFVPPFLPAVHASALRLTIVVMFTLAGGVAAGVPPQQAVVFDGSPSPSNTFLVSLSVNGFRLDLGTGGFQCPTSPRVSPGGVVIQGLAQQGVVRSAYGLATEVGTFLQAQPQLPLQTLLGAQDDCDLVALFPTIPPYLDQSVADAETLITDLTGCLSQVEQAYCDVVQAVESAVIDPNAPLLCYFGWSLLGFVEPGGLSSPESPSSGSFDCNLILEKLLVEVPSYLQEIQGVLASCEGVRSDLADVEAAIGDSLTQQDVDQILNGVDEWLAGAQNLPGVAQGVLAEIDALRNEITLAAVQSSCADCPFGTGRFVLSGVIALDRDTEDLSTIAETFQIASAAEPDRSLAARYTNIAMQMETIPSDRVLHFTYPTRKAVGSHTVALRDDSGADDGVSPLAVVISAEADGGDMNFIDTRVTRDVWHVLALTLDPTAGLPDDEDDDNDGVRDIHETNTGQLVSRTDTGTDPALFDTDGDLFSDGVEVDTGSDPGDPASTPANPVTGVVDENKPAQLAMWLLGPNPARYESRFAFRVDRWGPVSFEVHDVTGRLVRRLLPREIRPPGTYYQEWDLRAGNGHRVAAGVYFARLRAVGGTATRQITVVR